MTKDDMLLTGHVLADINDALIENDKTVRLKAAVDRLLESAAPSVWSKEDIRNLTTGDDPLSLDEALTFWVNATATREYSLVKHYGIDRYNTLYNRMTRNTRYRCMGCEECSSCSTERVNFPMWNLQTEGYRIPYSGTVYRQADGSFTDRNGNVVPPDTEILANYIFTVFTQHGASPSRSVREMYSYDAVEREREQQC